MAPTAMSGESDTNGSVGDFLFLLTLASPSVMAPSGVALPAASGGGGTELKRPDGGGGGILTLCMFPRGRARRNCGKVI